MCVHIEHRDTMSLEERDSKPTPELLAEFTGRPASEFELPEGMELPELEELEERDAADFHSE